MNSTGIGCEKAADRFLDHVLMLKDGISLCLGCMLYCDLSARESMSSRVLAVWRSESSEDLTALYEVLCSDPAGLAVAIAMYAMFLEHRPSRSRWELLFQYRHVIGGCAQLLHDAYKYPSCLEPSYKSGIDHRLGSFGLLRTSFAEGGLI